MNMAEAKQRLMTLAAGKYHSMEYTIDDHGNGHVSQKCRVYVSEYGHHDAPHWELALASLESAMAGAPRITEALPLSKAETTAA